MKNILSYLLILISFSAKAQPLTEELRNTNIHSIKLFVSGNQTTLPIVSLGSMEQLELHFDDLNDKSKNYFYTYQLCNANWTAANLSTFDFIKGYSQVRLSQFRASSISFTRYIHYSAKLPTQNSYPSRSGNYLLKVFENADTSKLIFSKRILVVDNKATLAARVIQPFDQKFFLTHQKVITTADIGKLDVYNPQQQLKIVVLQNNRWDIAMTSAAPTFIRGKQYEYNTEDNFIFEGGKEWRWLDLRSFRLQSDRVTKADYKNDSYDLYVRKDSARNPLRYTFYRDFNGQYFIETDDNNNPWWQSDYATVHFTYLPNGNNILKDLDVYVFGELTNFNTTPKNKMIFNVEKGQYELSLFLKKGYYNYSIVSKPQIKNTYTTNLYTEGNNWETENNYTILMYYRSFGGRSDELIAVSSINTLNLISR